MIDDPAGPSLHFQKLIDQVDRSSRVPEAWDFDLETDSFSRKLPKFMGQVLTLSIALKSMIPIEFNETVENSSTSTLQYKSEQLFNHIQMYMLSLERSFQELTVAAVALCESLEHLAQDKWFMNRGYSQVVDIILHTVQDILYDYSGENERVSNEAFQHFHEFYAGLEADTVLDEVTKQKLLNITQAMADNWNKCEFIIRNFHYSLKAYFPIFYGNARDFDQFQLSALRLVNTANLFSEMLSDKVYSVYDVLGDVEEGFDQNNEEFGEYMSTFSF